jgi:hypothetical protein
LHPDPSIVEDYLVRFSQQEELLLHQKEEEEKAKTTKSKPAPQKKNEHENYEKPTELLPPNLYKRVRHGFGIQIFQKVGDSVRGFENSFGADSGAIEGENDKGFVLEFIYLKKNNAY